MGNNLFNHESGHIFIKFILVWHKAIFMTYIVVIIIEMAWLSKLQNYSTSHIYIHWADINVIQSNKYWNI